MKHHDRATGFTLIELLITLAIIAILAAVALPNFQESITKSRRSDAQQLMVNIASRQEAFLLDASSYTNNFTTLNFSNTGWTCAGTSCSNSYYAVTVSVSSGPPPTFTITATPDASSSQSGDGTMTLTNTGVKTRTGVASGW
ncbi:MAG: prepilin-type N-terminal cleavage/methylation domain-containing protein [Magnetococcales bacterium]|nr:prepilin-type N-terminal cleavage/methylation domain-containing protein [Magnetococcales bacterium]